jgi:hypothetical protein
VLACVFLAWLKFGRRTLPAPRWSRRCPTSLEAADVLHVLHPPGEALGAHRANALDDDDNPPDRAGEITGLNSVPVGRFP